MARTLNWAAPDSPVECRRKEGSSGNGDWPGFEWVYCQISDAALRIGLSKLYLSDFHVDTMADLGSGHEERMKYRLMLLREYGWIK